MGQVLLGKDYSCQLLDVCIICFKVLYLCSSEETKGSYVKVNSELLATEHRLRSAGTGDNNVMPELAHPQVCYG